MFEVYETVMKISLVSHEVNNPTHSRKYGYAQRYGVGAWGRVGCGCADFGVKGEGDI